MTDLPAEKPAYSKWVRREPEGHRKVAFWCCIVQIGRAFQRDPFLSRRYSRKERCCLDAPCVNTLPRSVGFRARTDILNRASAVNQTRQYEEVLTLQLPQPKPQSRSPSRLLEQVRLTHPQMPLVQATPQPLVKVASSKVGAGRTSMALLTSDG